MKARISFSAAGNRILHCLSPAVLPAILVVSATLFPDVALSATYYVDESNGAEQNDGLSAESPLKYLRTAGGLAQPGDTVKILPGLYRDMGTTNAYDGFYVPNSGKPDNYITFSGVIDASGNRPVIESSALTGITLQTKSYIIVENLEIKGAEEDFLDLQGSIGTWAWESRGGVGILGDSHNIIVRNCYVHDFPGGGISVSDSDVVLVEDNVVEHTSWGSNYGHSGISFYKMTEQAGAVRFPEYPDHDVVIKNNVSRYNVNLRGTAAFEYALTDGNGIIVDDFKHTQGDESEAYGGSSLIIGNVSHGNGASGINVFQTENVDVLNNTSFDNGQSRRAENQPSDLVFNQAHQPIQVGGSANTYVANNIFVRADDDSSMISEFWNDEDSVVIEGNLFWNSVGTVGQVPAGNTVADPEFADARALTQEQTNLLATLVNVYYIGGLSASLREPTVTNGFPVNDFSLNSNSPAIDAGVDTGYRDNVNGGPDLGAIEFAGTAASIPDDLVSFIAPDAFEKGKANLVAVEYSASQARDLMVMLEDADENYRQVAFERVRLGRGSGTVDVELFLNADSAAHDNYKLNILLTTVGGYHSSAFDSIASAGNVVN